MSIHDKDLLSGKTKVEIAIERIRYFCTGKKTLVAFSGGKLDMSLARLARAVGYMGLRAEGGVQGEDKLGDIMQRRFFSRVFDGSKKIKKS